MYWTQCGTLCLCVFDNNRYVVEIEVEHHYFTLHVHEPRILSLSEKQEVAALAIPFLFSPSLVSGLLTRIEMGCIALGDTQIMLLS